MKSRERILLESILRIARRGRMVHTSYHADLRAIAKQAAVRLRALRLTGLA